MKDDYNPDFKTSMKDSTPAGAWQRYWARWVDGVVGAIFFSLFIGAPALTLMGTPGEIFLAMLLLALWVPIEAWALSQFGTTPGKALLMVSVRTASGDKLTFQQALRRAWNVYVEGQCLGIPLGVPITQLVASVRLKKKGITSWDEAGGFVVTTGAIELGRKIAIVLLILVTIGLVMAGTAAFMGPDALK